MIRPIILYPDQLLHQVSAPVEVYGPGFTAGAAIDELITDLFETMYTAGGVGLSAIQIGAPCRVFVMDATDAPYVFVNPELVTLGGIQCEVSEGCLSVPGVHEKILRYPMVTVQALGAKGNLFTRTFRDLEAQCIAHEIEHLDGIVFPDKISPLRRERVKAKMAKYRRRNL